jgi:tetratricopeptide (TPR) repeat protein
MGVIFNTDKRRIIPRWRSYTIASKTGELLVSDNKLKSLPFLDGSYLVEQQKAWESYKDISHAGDLLSSAYVLGIASEFKGVARFVLDNEDNPTSPLVKLANTLLNIDNTIEQVSTSSDNAILNEFIIDYRKYQPEISRNKWLLNREPKNPIANLELGRLYTLIGDVDKAKKYINIALQLDKNNRFIARSASRFYHHVSKESDRALEIIKNSEFVKFDPWLISADIAYSSILGRHTKATKIGMEILNKIDKNFLSITELASAIGTLEFSEGNLKNSRKYFKQALLQPNDNSLAQVGWMIDKIDGVDLNILKYNIPLAYEARAHGFYNQEKINESLECTMRWLDDEPYSSRPIRLASSLWGDFLKNRERSIKLLEQGLKVNPNDIAITNNLIYYLALENKIEYASKLFESTIGDSLDDIDINSRISLTATAGLLFYRQDLPEEGKRYYAKAISLAKSEKNSYLIALATANYTREELRYTNDKDPLINQLKEVCKDENEPDVKVLYKDILNEYDAFKNQNL